MPSKPRGSPPIARANPSEAAALDEGLVGRTDRIAVDAPGRDLLAVASLQRLVDADDERAFSYERL
jgi:hypothetical protein